MKQSVMALSEQFVEASIAYLQATLDGDETARKAAILVFCDKYRNLRSEEQDGVDALIALTTHERREVRVMAASVVYIMAPALAGPVLEVEAAMVDSLEPGTLEFVAAERASVTFMLYEAGLKAIAYKIQASRASREEDNPTTSPLSLTSALVCQA